MPGLSFFIFHFVMRRIGGKPLSWLVAHALHTRCDLASPGRPARTHPRRESALMRINIWIVLIVLIVLFAVTRLLQYQRDTQRICADDPSASVCAR